MPYNCSYCICVGFSYKKALRKHLATTHREEYLEHEKVLCELCYERLSSDFELASHTAALHSKHKCDVGETEVFKHDWFRTTYKIIYYKKFRYLQWCIIFSFLFLTDLWTPVYHESSSPRAFTSTCWLKTISVQSKYYYYIPFQILNLEYIYIV